MTINRETEGRVKMIILNKGDLEALPPVVSVIFLAKSFGFDVSVIAEYCSDNLCKMLSREGVKIYLIRNNRVKKNKAIFAKIINWITFRYSAWKILKKITSKSDKIWLGSADTALAFGKKVKSWDFYLQIHELYDQKIFYKVFLKSYARNAKAVIVPDSSRAAIFRTWWNLKSTPIVLPNKPYFHGRERNLQLTNDDVRRIVYNNIQTPIILYQGHIDRGRNLDNFCRAVKKISVPCKVLLMGKDHGYLEKLKKINSDIIYVGYLPPPNHLEVTSYATVGIIQYDFSCLNHVFCAPNKLWEYAGFGVATLAADLPPLRNYIEKFNAGECCDFYSENDIAEKLEIILKNPDRYKSGALKLYDSVDLSHKFKNIFDQNHLKER